MPGSAGLQTSLATVTPTSIRQLCELKIKEESGDSGSPAAPSIDGKNWRKTVDAPQDHFCCIFAEKKAHLAHVIPDEAEVCPKADNPIADHAMPKGGMIACMPHQDATGNNSPTCIHDRSKAWETVSEACRNDKVCWTCLKPPQCTKDGREAFQARLHAHCTGANQVNDATDVAKSKLATAKCHGKNRR
jgi:hypothetical protein